MLDVRVNRLRGQEERPGDLAIRAAACQESEHFDLACRQACDGLDPATRPVTGNLQDRLHGTPFEAAGQDLGVQLTRGLPGFERGAVGAHLGHRRICVGCGEHARTRGQETGRQSARIPKAVESLMVQRRETANDVDTADLGQDPIGLVRMQAHPLPIVPSQGALTAPVGELADRAEGVVKHHRVQTTSWRRLEGEDRGPEVAERITAFMASSRSGLSPASSGG